MKKIMSALFVAVSLFATASAYNPPVGGENLFEYSSPDSLAGKTTVTGGAVFSAGADSLVINPALAASEQRINLNLGYTFLHSGNQDSLYKIGSAFQTGILIPFKMFVFSGYLNGTFVPFSEMNLGNSITLKASVSKEITEKLDVGLGISTGVAWNKTADWSLGASLGFNYKYGDLGFFKDFRYGASILNLGKNYNLLACTGVKPGENSSQYPNILTIKLGAAGSLIKTDDVNFGIALDLSTAMFQNLIVDLNTQLLIKDFLVFNIGERINVRESINNRWSAIPSVSIGVKFALDVKNSEYLSSKGWSKSDMTVSAGYRNLYNTVNAASVGVNVDLGMKDTEPPVIEFLDEE